MVSLPCPFQTQWSTQGSMEGSPALQRANALGGPGEQHPPPWPYLTPSPRPKRIQGLQISYFENTLVTICTKTLNSWRLCFYAYPATLNTRPVSNVQRHGKKSPTSWHHPSKKEKVLYIYKRNKKVTFTYGGHWMNFTWLSIFDFGKGGVETKGKEVQLWEMQFNFLLNSSINPNCVCFNK